MNKSENRTKKYFFALFIFAEFNLQMQQNSD